MIWNIIRDFIVRYITGGYSSIGDYYDVSLGEWSNEEIQFYINRGATQLDGSSGGVSLYNTFTYTLSDWLATTLTVVIMIIGVVLLCLLVRWVFKTVVNAFAFRR